MTSEKMIVFDILHQKYGNAGVEVFKGGIQTIFARNCKESTLL
jgi:hypothetical protein